MAVAPDSPDRPSETDRSWLGPPAGAPVPLRRGHLILFERGFLAGEPGREKAVLFGEVQTLAIDEQARFDRALAGTVARRVTVRSATGTLRFEHRAVDGLPDPGTPALHALLAGVTDVVDQRLRGGGLFTGRGWSLAADGFRIRRGASVPLSALARAGLFLGRVRLWKQGEERPFFSLAAGSPNARVLAGVLIRRLAGHVEPASGPLGRFLFRAGRVRYHENGVVKAGVRGDRELLFAQVERVRLQAASQTRRTVTYQGSGTEITARFPASHESHQLFLGRPAALLADRLEQRLATEGQILWVDGVRITPEGLLVPRRDGEPELVAFAQGPRLHLTGGRFHLLLSGETRPALTIGTGAWDFFPGLFVLERLYSGGFGEPPPP